LYPVLLTSLLEAADRADSTTGVQMAYVKQWAPRSNNLLQLRVPELVAAGRGGPGRRARSRARRALRSRTDPPYNQHRYFTNYHVWETLVARTHPTTTAWRAAPTRDPATKSVFNDRRAMPDALAAVINEVDADLVIVSYNNESWVAIDALEAMCGAGGEVRTLN
jgi:adenine-specific DNA-methyltransferase